MTEERVNDTPREDDGLNELLARARADDEDAFAELLDRYSGLLAGAVSHLPDGLSAMDVEDLRQEAMITFCNAVRSYEPGQGQVTFGLYAKICVRNSLVSKLRSMQARLGQAVLPLDHTQPDEEIDPAEQLAGEDSFRELQGQIDRILSSYERQVFWMYVTGIPACQIAGKLDSEQKSVENAIYRIRRKLRTQLKK